MKKAIFKSICLALALCGVVSLWGQTPQWGLNGANIYNLNSGKVGIGTNNPRAKLDVSGDASVNKSFTIGPYSDSYRGLTIDNGASYGWSFLHFKNVNGTHMVVNGDGKVGIGTTSPAAKLHVHTSSSSEQAAFFKGRVEIRDSDLIFKNVNNGSEFLFHNQWQNINDNWLQIAPGDGNGNWNFARALRLNNEGELVKKIDSESKVAFAVSHDDTYNFQVMGNGKVYARDVEVSLEPFPDYVFEEDYALLPLAELKTYIQTEKHLPNMPSAAEVAENGMGLSSLNLKQTEKIEELTLYILQLDERLKKVEAENDALKKQLAEK